ncbi:DNA cytosine methyltransferase [Amycolatopsis australiensis]|uniref:DNA (cytosine-5-)-methyltransferase n=1 Tax=Amycolatopsis australiensis TaxID=546364 RepID=A0A1K1Q568_9PSEU|nr:DNA cytosine methyltransferase [Amycolatopsis australiensis]SFW54861.1 DNA (cytosine-5)-methyltransferase 1 [Amycolatopsis australiensis]
MPNTQFDSNSHSRPRNRLTSLEVCAGAGGLALGLEQAGFDPVVLIEERAEPCNTLRLNRPAWDVRQMDLRDFDPADDKRVYDVDLLSAGLPRVKASAANNRRRGDELELELLQATVLLVLGVQPRALLIENMPELVTSDKFIAARKEAEKELDNLGYVWQWLVVNASNYGVPQERRHGVLVAFKNGAPDCFEAPPQSRPPLSVGELLRESMASRGWPRAEEWARMADCLAPTLVGGSWNRGGPDLGPSGSKKRWAKMGVNGRTVADLPPGPDFDWRPELGEAGGVPLTVAQAATLQGFPADWQFSGTKTHQYRQVGNATPPPVGRALGLAIRRVLEGR